MIQQIIILVVFIASIAYLVRLVYKGFMDTGCSSGCGKCAIADFKKMEKQLKSKGF